MKKLIVIAAVAASMVSFGTAIAGDAAAGKTKATTVCAACHGPAGISVAPQFPNLAGQKEAYIVKQLKAFKAGTRTDPIMAPQAAPLSDADIENVAAYFASLK
ncbi:c-type cytochrome [Thiolapillus sp.]